MKASGDFTVDEKQETVVKIGLLSDTETFQALGQSLADCQEERDFLRGQNVVLYWIVIVMASLLMVGLWGRLEL